MNYISDVLFWISTGLLVPVVVLLILLFIRALILAGSFFGQYLNVRKIDVAVKKILDTTNRNNLEELEYKLPKKGNSLALAYMKRIVANHTDKAVVRRLIDEFEFASEKDLDVSKSLTKLGPMLGLMGTLIPMGPALVGLSTGDISSMAYNMQVAFATTVVGLFSSAVGFITQQVKQRWYLQELSDLEFVAALSDKENN